MKMPKIMLGKGFKSHEKEGHKDKPKPQEAKELKAGKKLKGAGIGKGMK
jgi:hypothetical protein